MTVDAGGCCFWLLPHDGFDDLVVITSNTATRMPPLFVVVAAAAMSESVDGESSAFFTEMLMLRSVLWANAETCFANRSVSSSVLLLVVSPACRSLLFVAREDDDDVGTGFRHR